MIKVTVRNKDGIDDIIQMINEDVFNFKDELMNLSGEVLDFMRDYVNSRKKRDDKVTANTGKLEEVLDVDEKYDTGNTFGWGIGDEDKLNKDAKYWKVLNFGSDHIVGMKVPGEFPSGKPVADGSGEAFIKTGGSYLMIPKEPIVGIDYIENTRALLERRIIEIANNFGKR
jgi:hypothetical protein